MTVFDEKLQELQKQMARQKKLRAEVDDLQRNIAALAVRERDLAAARAAEQVDVDKLEGRTLAAWFYGLTGSRENRLEAERQQARAAAVKHDAVVLQLQEAKEELRVRQKELDGLRGCEMQYQETLRKKAQVIKERDSVRGGEILELEEKIGWLDGQCAELNEAISAGGRACSQADRVLEHLNSAESLSTWDMMGGGLLTDLAKHEELDCAQEQTEHLQLCLDRFRTELADVTIHADLCVQMDEFTRFADFFFDGLFADWAVRDHIHQSQDRVSHTRSKIRMVLNRLEQMRREIIREREQAKQKLDELIIRS